MDASVESLQELFFEDACCRVPDPRGFSRLPLCTPFSLQSCPSHNHSVASEVAMWILDMALQQAWQRFQEILKDGSRTGLPLEIYILWPQWILGLQIQNESSQAGVCKMVISKGEMPCITMSGAARASILLPEMLQVNAQIAIDNLGQASMVEF